MSDYTPTTQAVRLNYITANAGPYRGGEANAAAAFDRWLAAHDAQKRAEWEAEQGEGHAEYAEYAVEFDGGITQVSDDRGDVEDWVQWIVGGRLVQREVYTTRWVRAPDTGAAARSLRECAICGEKTPLSHATPEWEARHKHTTGAES